MSHSLLAPGGNAPALRDDLDASFLSYDALSAAADRWADLLAGTRRLIFLFARNNCASVAAFLGAVKAGHAVALLDPLLPAEARARLIAVYQPEIVIRDGEIERSAYTAREDLHPSLAVLLSTSGSTGSPKFVRLTLDSLISNAQSIGAALEISPGDTASGHLPLHYSYGLSVLTSHLLSGAAVALTEKSLTDRTFWTLMTDARITQFAGVPFHFQMMRRLNFSRLEMPYLKVMTQAGGRLERETRDMAHAYMSSRQGRFHVMYGQTEASPRITTLSHDDYVMCPDSVGPAVPGGKLVIADAVDGEGEVIYLGPNVMMGYAEGRQDLGHGDELEGILRTGDIGRLDAEGRLTITGRVKRFGKVYGLRVNLDEIEKLVAHYASAAVIQKNDRIRIFHGPLDDQDIKRVMKDALQRNFSLPLTVFEFREILEIPHTSRGKVDYNTLEGVV